MREEAARALVRERSKTPFASIADLARRVPSLSRQELVTLADIGALNRIGGRSASFSMQIEPPHSNFVSDKLATVPEFPVKPEKPNRRFHRRDALWQAEAAARPLGELLEQVPKADAASPLAQMTDEERLVADFRGTGVTVGPHPLAYYRENLNQRGVRRAADLAGIPNGRPVKVAGAIIIRQRPGTAHGFVFLSIEDETGIANVIITPDMFDRHRMTLVEERYLLVEGVLQNVDRVVSVKAARVTPLRFTETEVSSRNFH